MGRLVLISIFSGGARLISLFATFSSSCCFSVALAFFIYRGDERLRHITAASNHTHIICGVYSTSSSLGGRRLFEIYYTPYTFGWLLCFCVLGTGVCRGFCSSTTSNNEQEYGYSDICQYVAFLDLEVDLYIDTRVQRSVSQGQKRTLLDPLQTLAVCALEWYL